jgi:hypothetical protein
VDPTIRFFCYLGAAVCFALAALGGTRSGSPGQPAVLVPLGLLLFILPAVWDSGELAF